MRLHVGTAAFAAVLVFGAASASATTTPADRAAGKKAARWLAQLPTERMSPGLQADIIVALERAGASPRSLRGRVDRLAAVGPGYATTPGAAAKIALAAQAAGRDPRRLGGVNYLGRITSRYRKGQYGSSSFDQALSILALDAAGRRIPPSARSFLSSRRGAGGWSFDLRRTGRDEVDSTALVIVALRAAGVPKNASIIRGSHRWLVAQRNPEAGYAVLGRRQRTGANATALAVQAEIALDQAPNPRTLAALRRLQERTGAIRFTKSQAGDRSIATAGSVPALMGRSS